MNPSDPPPERSAGSAPPEQEKPPQPAREGDLWERIFAPDNLERALRRVERNGGAPGIDGMGTEDLRSHLQTHWPQIRTRLDAGHYRPAPTRRVEIPKPSGGVRSLGVPTVLDRLIQQAVLQVLEGLFEPTFSEHSYGFRPRRSAHMAVSTARRYVQEGRPWAVDVDLEAFFDRVNHDVLMHRVGRVVRDKRVLRLLGAYLRAGTVLQDGVRVAGVEGTPQGSPLSPLLANVLLTDLDREFEARGHAFVRYADDIRVYVRSRRAGERVLESVSRFLEDHLRLRVNEGKSGVDRATRRGLLGFAFFYRPTGEVAVRVDKRSLDAAKDRIRRLTARSWGVSMAVRLTALNTFIAGWSAYFAFAETPSVFERLDKWLLRRLRQVRWKEWKRPVTKRRRLRELGVPARTARQWAYTGKGSWRIAGSAPLQRAMPRAYWEQLGLRRFGESTARVRSVWRTAECGPACSVVWEGPG